MSLILCHKILAYPYVQIGDDSLSDNSTKDLDGNIHSIVIHTWSRYRGDKEAKQIMARDI